MYRSQDRGGNKEAAELAPNSEAFPTSKKTSLFGAIFAGSCLCPRVPTTEAWIKVCACFQAWLLLHFNLRSVPTCILEDNHRPVDLRIARTCCGTLDQQAVWRTGTRVNQAGWYLVRYLDTWIPRYINTFCGGESKEHKGCDCVGCEIDHRSGGRRALDVRKGV